MSYIALDDVDIALAAALLIVHAALAIWQRLGLARQLMIAALRMIVQLSLLGLVLRFLFRDASPYWSLLAALVMIGFAGYEIVARQSRRLSLAWTYAIGTSVMLVGGGIVTAYALTVLIRPEPVYDPRYALPLLGMLLGNTMTGIALGIGALFDAAARERAAIEAQLTLGADRWTALRPVLRRAMRNGMTPIVNAMAATGLVSIPGMMTGQVLAGVEPMDAARYQMMIMFLIGGVVALGTTAAVYMAAWRLTDSRHRLRADRLTVLAE